MTGAARSEGLAALFGRPRTFALGLLLMLGCSGSPAPGSSPAATPSPGSALPDPGAVLPGAWTCPDSSAVWRVSVTDGVLGVSGDDGADGERFEVTDVVWDGSPVARFTARMPSTDWTVRTTLRVLDRNRLSVERSGPAPYACVAQRTGR